MSPQSFSRSSGPPLASLAVSTIVYLPIQVKGTDRIVASSIEITIHVVRKPVNRRIQPTVKQGQERVQQPARLLNEVRPNPKLHRLTQRLVGPTSYDVRKRSVHSEIMLVIRQNSAIYFTQPPLRPDCRSESGLGVPEDVGHKRSNECGESRSEQRMVARPPLDHLAWCLSCGRETKDIEGGDKEDQERPPGCYELLDAHQKKVPVRCHSHRPAIRPPIMNTSKVQSFCVFLMHMM